MRFTAYAVLICLALAVHADPSDVITDPTCTSDVFDDKAKVHFVIDGDTVVLADGRHVRLVGVNTSELGYGHTASQPFADTARTTLESLVTSQPHVGIRYDATRHDRYGRMLAHLFLDDGTNIQAWLLQQGLGTRLTIPPNLMYLDCYSTAETRARHAARGIWANSEYRPIAATELTADQTGFRIVTGDVLRIGESRSAIWITIAPKVALRIRRDDLIYFDNVEFQNLMGRRVVARGWLYTKGNELRMRIRHPANLQIAEPSLQVPSYREAYDRRHTPVNWFRSDRPWGAFGSFYRLALYPAKRSLRQRQCTKNVRN
ncbi:MAG: thermonuclease family protein [Gammaproteobacteria bacterium]|nr:thermonuclease family protein [Gammaproteobacteria bacterium]MCI0591248.1 thermonuclease family protein [Gammaproteobacteria bacterium]